MNLEKIKALDAKEVFAFYGFPVDRKGFTICPFHSEKTPSCKVSEHGFFCFGCNEHGDAISLVERLYNLDFAGAVARLNEDFSLGMRSERKLTFAEREEQRKREQNRARTALEALKKKIKYETALQRYAQADKTITALMPKTQEEYPAPEFFEALEKRNEAERVLDEVGV